MSRKVGIWIDLHKAVIISMEAEKQNVKTVESGIETRERLAGEKKDFGRFGDQYIDHEKKKEHRLKHETDNYIKSLTQEVKDADEIVIFGPADMKNKLNASFQKVNSLKEKVRGVETADSMTENQMVAWTKEYFN